MDDDYGISYYFRGAVDNNWVYYAGAYWRIIRINGDGSVRMIYSGTTAPTSTQSVVMTGTQTQLLSTSAFASSYSSSYYVGYMYTASQQYGLTNSSTIKGVVDSWYSSNISGTAWEDYIADAIYCGDRTTSSTTWSNTTALNYAANERIYKYDYTTSSIMSDLTVTPTFKCTMEEDSYTVLDENGNGALTYSVGLITADEVSAAGLVSYYVNSTYNTTNYLYTNQVYRTMSPSGFSSSYADVISVNGTGYVSSFFTTSTYGVRPVVSLKSDTLFTGSGEWNDVYTVIVSEEE